MIIRNHHFHRAPIISLILFLFIFLGNLTPLFASQDAVAGTHNHVTTFLWIIILLMAAKISSLIERLGQPAVLGELLIGVVLGNLTLIGISFLEPIKSDVIIIFFAEFGVVILLFQIGLGSSIKEMLSVGKHAALVAIVGVSVPFITGTYLVGPLFLPGLSFNSYLFLGATLTATSVGITARVFRDLNKLNSPEAKIVLGAAVIDDVLGLIILAVVSAIVTTGTISLTSISWIVFKAGGFLIGAVLAGQLFSPYIGHFFSLIHPGHGMKFSLTISICLIFAYFSSEIGLAPIVGAFAAGLILDPVHFQHFRKPQIFHQIKELIKDADHPITQKISSIIDTHSEKHIEDLIEPLGFFFVPIFFVVTGMAVKLETLFDLKALLIALSLTLVAIGGKVVSGLVAGPVKKSLVGWGMVPRGEVGLIFAAIGKTLGVISDDVFSIIVIMVILTTLCTPPILAYIIRRQDKKDNS